MAFGFLNINKPQCISSSKVTNFIKYILKEKVGHIGTLDPLASGVLPIAVGKATKLIPLFEDNEKIYEFTIQFGAKTSTSDAAGSIFANCKNTPPFQECQLIVKKFIGSIKQIPSAFSAIKIDGIRAYKLARLGKLTTTNKERTVIISDLCLKNYNQELRQATYKVKCAKGTYVRSLTEDICESLNALGFALSINRISSSGMDIADSICFKMLKNIPSQELIQLLEKKLEEGNFLLYNTPKITILEEDYCKVIRGQLVNLNQYKNNSSKKPQRNTLVYFQNKIIALGDITEENIFYPKKMLI